MPRGGMDRNVGPRGPAYPVRQPGGSALGVPIHIDRSAYHLAQVFLEEGGVVGQVRLDVPLRRALLARRWLGYVLEHDALLDRGHRRDCHSPMGEPNRPMYRRDVVVLEFWYRPCRFRIVRVAGRGVPKPPKNLDTRAHSRRATQG